MTGGRAAATSRYLTNSEDRKSGVDAQPSTVPVRKGRAEMASVTLMDCTGPFEVVKDATAFGLIIFSSGEDIGGVSNKRLVSFQMDLIH